MREFLKELFTKRKKYDFGYILSLSISILLALGVGAAIMLILGYNPLEGYGALIKGAFGSTRALGDTLAKSVTLAMTALAMAVAAKAGMFNVGGEGQLFLGAMAAAVMGAVLMGVSPIIAIPVCMLAAIIAGGVYAYIPAILKVRLGVNEVITTIMMNSIAIYLCVYLSNGPLKTAEKGIASGTQAIDPDFKFTKLITNS
ncbi:MAG: ABC transporter permease, partial [Clostridiales bacterium]|nr:ABC transporter permease [Clostridiales bacterium]